MFPSRYCWAFALSTFWIHTACSHVGAAGDLVVPSSGRILLVRGLQSTPTPAPTPNPDPNCTSPTPPRFSCELYGSFYKYTPKGVGITLPGAEELFSVEDDRWVCDRVGPDGKKLCEISGESRGATDLPLIYLDDYFAAQSRALPYLIGRLKLRLRTTSEPSGKITQIRMRAVSRAGQEVRAPVAWPVEASYYYSGFPVDDGLVGALVAGRNDIDIEVEVSGCGVKATCSLPVRGLCAGKYLYPVDVQWKAYGPPGCLCTGCAGTGEPPCTEGHNEYTVGEHMYREFKVPGAEIWEVPKNNPTEGCTWDVCRNRGRPDEHCDPRGVKPGCFDGAARIALASGGSRRADAVAAGDWLWNPVRREPVQVRRLIVGPEKLPLVEIVARPGAVRVTTEHPMITERGVVRADALRPGDRVLGDDRAFHPVLRVRRVPVVTGQLVYNFELDTFDPETDAHLLLAEGIVTGDYHLQSTVTSKLGVR